MQIAEGLKSDWIDKCLDQIHLSISSFFIYVVIEMNLRREIIKGAHH